MDWLFNIGRCRSGKHRKEVEEDRYCGRTNNGHLVHRITKEKIKATVPLPVGVEIHEWLATNTLSFFTNIKLMYESLQAYCTPVACNTVFTSATINFVWADNGKKAKLTAPEYIDIIIIRIEKYLTDEAVFPTRYDRYFPQDFFDVVKKIFRMMFHILLHIYQSHQNHIVEFEELETANTVLTHFMLFQREHNLMATPDIRLLEDLVRNMSL